MEYTGHLNRLYVHKDFQGKGIATALVKALEAEAIKLNLRKISTEASITAQPFFEKRGHQTVCAQLVERKGVQLRNFKMMKNLLSPSENG